MTVSSTGTPISTTRDESGVETWVISPEAARELRNTSTASLTAAVDDGRGTSHLSDSALETRILATIELVDRLEGRIDAGQIIAWEAIREGTKLEYRRRHPGVADVDVRVDTSTESPTPYAGLVGHDTNPLVNFRSSLTPSAYEATRDLRASAAAAWSGAVAKRTGLSGTQNAEFFSR